jgi:hypothetical protein
VCVCIHYTSNSVDVAMADVCLTMMPNSIPRYARTGDPIAIQKQGAAGQYVYIYAIFLYISEQEIS